VKLSCEKATDHYAERRFSDVRVAPGCLSYAESGTGREKILRKERLKLFFVGTAVSPTTVKAISFLQLFDKRSQTFPVLMEIGERMAPRKDESNPVFERNASNRVVIVIALAT